MKKAIALFALASASLVAGPLKVATYPFAHSHKTVHGARKAVKGVAKGTFKVGKALVW